MGTKAGSVFLVFVERTLSSNAKIVFDFLSIFAE